MFCCQASERRRGEPEETNVPTSKRKPHPVPQAKAPVPASTARRQPVQQRSQERMDRILSVAERLIGTTGSDAVKMSEIAAQAEISIGSLYQYFPDKRAIVRRLAERQAAESRLCIQRALSAVRDKAGLLNAFSALVDQYYAIVRGTPVIRDIAAAMRADKQLQALELVESKACGALLAAAIRRVFPASDAKRVNTTAFLIWQLGEETMRLALGHKRSEAVLLVEAYKRVGLRALSEP